MERLPGYALGIDRPVLVALRVAARCRLLRRKRNIGLGETGTDLFQLLVALGLQAQVIDACVTLPRRDGEVDARILELPLGVVVLEDGWLRREQRRVETDALLQVMYADVNVKPLHWPFLSG